LYAGKMNSFIHSYRWRPPVGVPQRSHGVYLLHGTGEHAGRYEQLATRLAAAGWLVGAHDQPGHGQSSGKRGLIDPPGALVTQSAIQIQAFANETGSMPIVFGHSLGGVVATELVLQHGLNVKGLILSAPAFVPITSTMDRIKLRLLTLIAPRLCLDLGYNASRLTHDERTQNLAHADPLIHSYKSSTLVNWLMQSGQRSIDMAATLNCPTLLLIAGDDLVVESDKTRLFASRVCPEKLTLSEYKGFYHELLNETPERRELVLADIENWLAQFA
jgi:alpha-beta hydrolase superfamily lysophospholipase